MGYDLRIGELDVSVGGEGLESYILLGCKAVRRDDAPAFGEPTDFSNDRRPSYSAWHDVASALGLEDLFYNKETGLLRRHPGCFPLTPAHKQIIDEAYANFYAKYPDVKAGYFAHDDALFDANACAARLEWLKYWVDWALTNCAVPVFCNS